MHPPFSIPYGLMEEILHQSISTGAGFLPSNSMKQEFQLRFACWVAGKIKKYSPTWWCKMVMNPMGSESVKHHQLNQQNK